MSWSYENFYLGDCLNSKKQVSHFEIYIPQSLCLWISKDFALIQFFSFAVIFIHDKNVKINLKDVIRFALIQFFPFAVIFIHDKNVKINSKNMIRFYNILYSVLPFKRTQYRVFPTYTKMIQKLLLHTPHTKRQDMIIRTGWVVWSLWTFYLLWSP